MCITTNSFLIVTGDRWLFFVHDDMIINIKVKLILKISNKICLLLSPTGPLVDNHWTIFNHICHVPSAGVYWLVHIERFCLFWNLLQKHWDSFNTSGFFLNIYLVVQLKLDRYGIQFDLQFLRKLNQWIFTEVWQTACIIHSKHFPKIF